MSSRGRLQKFANVAVYRAVPAFATSRGRSDAQMPFTFNDLAERFLFAPQRRGD
jgi:hypothetical protein